jgi:hypothetical protein
MDRKKTDNKTKLDQLGPDRWLRLHTFWMEGPIATGPVATGSKPNWFSSKVALANTFKMHLKTLKRIKI